MIGPAPTSYSELASVIESMPTLVRERRRTLGVGIREAGRQLDVSASTVSRIENGEDYNARILPGLLRWLGGEVAPSCDPPPGATPGFAARQVID